MVYIYLDELEYLFYVISSSFYKVMAYTNDVEEENFMLYKYFAVLSFDFHFILPMYWKVIYGLIWNNTIYTQVRQHEKTIGMWRS